jgi:peroxiredoxin
MRKTIFTTLIALLFAFGSQAQAQVPTASTDISPLLIGETVPDATLIDSEGNAKSFYSLIQDKPAVVIFYRGDWCGNCITHFKEEIAPNMAEITGMGYNVIAISPDSPENLVVTSGKTGLPESVLFGDGDGTLAKGFGIAFKQAERMVDLLTQSSGGKNVEMLLPVPGVYVIGTDHKITFEYINPNGPQSALRMKWSLLKPVLQALK